jgi:hypothetical protein
VPTSVPTEGCAEPIYELTSIPEASDTYWLNSAAPKLPGAFARIVTGFAVGGVVSMVPGQVFVAASQGDVSMQVQPIAPAAEVALSC